MNSQCNHPLDVWMTCYPAGVLMRGRCGDYAFWLPRIRLHMGGLWIWWRGRGFGIGF